MTAESSTLEVVPAALVVAGPAAGEADFEALAARAAVDFADDSTSTNLTAPCTTRLEIQPSTHRLIL